MFGLPSARRKWRRGRARAARKKGIDLAAIGLTEADLLRDPGTSTGDRLYLKDGSITGSRGQDQVDSSTALEPLLEKENESSYFKWEPILTRIANRFDLADIDRLATKFETRYRAPFTLAVLAKRAAQLGNLSKAWALGLRALDISREYGWSKWADGGSRLAAFQALVRVDKNRGRELAYQTLAADGGVQPEIWMRFFHFSQTDSREGDLVGGRKLSCSTVRRS